MSVVNWSGSRLIAAWLVGMSLQTAMIVQFGVSAIMQHHGGTSSRLMEPARVQIASGRGSTVVVTGNGVALSKSSDRIALIESDLERNSNSIQLAVDAPISSGMMSSRSVALTEVQIGPSVFLSRSIRGTPWNVGVFMLLLIIPAILMTCTFRWISYSEREAGDLINA